MAVNRKTKRIIWVVVIVLLALLVAAIVAIKGKLNLIQYDDGETPNDVTIQAAEEDDVALDLSGLDEVEAPQLPTQEIYSDQDVQNILLLGTDERGDEFSENARSDSMLILSLNREKNMAKLISLERGMGVPILEGPYQGQYDWLTHCFRYGGAGLVMREVQTCFRVDVTHFIRVNFYAVVRIVDLLGGIDLNLTQAEADYINQEHHDYNPNGQVQTVSPGANHVNGATALAYARCRKIDSNWQRVQRQQNVIQACANRLKGADLGTLNELLNQVLPMVQTNFTQWEVARLMLSAPGFLGVQFERMAVPAAGTYGSMTGMGGRSMYAPDFAENARLIREFLYG